VAVSAAGRRAVSASRKTLSGHSAGVEGVAMSCGRAAGGLGFLG